jgi:hypothetical protein
MRLCFLTWIICTIFCAIGSIRANEPVFIEAESFADKGGWAVDQQYMDVMGSPVLLAHGMGEPVADAVTEAVFPKPGTYRVFVRTRNWISPWTTEYAPGKFQLSVNGKKLETVFGTEGDPWHWQSGGTVEIKDTKTKIALHDLTGFDGRLDAIIFTNDEKYTPPEDVKEIDKIRRKTLKLAASPLDALSVEEGQFDLVVVGGGIAGCCASISAARLGCKVALVQNRPVLGGNNSSEVRVGLSGLISQNPYPNLGNLLDELGPVGYWNNWESQQHPETERSKQIAQIINRNPEKKTHNAGPASNYEDEKKKQLVLKEPNIRLFLNTQVYKVQKDGNSIVSVTGKDIITGKESVFKGSLFADCTGDGVIGFLAGADYRMGRESKAETGEPHAPEQADQLTMGTSVQWYADEIDTNASFPECPWAIQFNEKTCRPGMRGDWDWETGLNRNQVTDIEFIRDYGLRAVFGN